MQDSVENLVTLFENGTLNRQQLIQGLLAVMAPISMVAHAHADTSTTSTFRGRSLNHVTLSVIDVERSQEFYSRLLGGTISGRSVETDKGAKVESATLARIGTTNATAAGAAGVRPGPGSTVNRAADPQRPLRGGDGEGRHRDRPLPCAAVGWWSRGGQRGAAPAVGGSVESGTEARAT
jgi:catechol 2,3-dioxygenase-like lactoylglutathione lyase family enzyme